MATGEKSSPSLLGTSVSTVLKGKKGKSEDLAEVVKLAVEAAMKPFLEKLYQMKRRIDKTEKDSDATRKMVEAAEKTAVKSESLIRNINKESKMLENHIIGLEIEKSKTVLRIQNLQEDQGENLKDVISTFLGPIVKAEISQVKSTVQEVYRTSSRYAAAQALSRKITVVFTTKEMRDIILFNSFSAELDYKDKKIKILKDIPVLARKRHAKYI